MKIVNLTVRKPLILPPAMFGKKKLAKKVENMGRGSPVAAADEYTRRDGWSGPSLMRTKALLRWCILFTAPLHQGDALGLQTIISRKQKQRRDSETHLQSGNTCRQIGFTYARISK